MAFFPRIVQEGQADDLRIVYPEFENDGFSCSRRRRKNKRLESPVRSPLSLRHVQEKRCSCLIGRHGRRLLGGAPGGDLSLSQAG